jgi:hypothetical protein
MNQEEMEESAFYESGLSADGCLENLDSYARTAIEKYGRILLQNQKQSHDEEIKKYKHHLADASDHYIKILSDYTKLDDETRVEIQDLESQLKDIQEYGTEEINSAIDLRNQLVRSKEETDKYKEIAKKLYSVALHVEELAKSRCNIIVVGPGLYSEAEDSVKEYEELEKNNEL